MSATNILDIGLEASGPTTVVRLAGELDLQSVAQLSTAFEEALAASPAAIAFDLRELEFIDSSGIHSLLATGQRCAQEHVRFVLVGGQPPVRRALALCGLDDRLEHVSSLDELCDEPPPLAATV